MAETIAERLKRLRKTAGLTQAQLADAVGVTQSAIGNIETGLRDYGASVVGIAKVLGTTPAYLMLEAESAHQASDNVPPDYAQAADDDLATGQADEIAFMFNRLPKDRALRLDVYLRIMDQIRPYLARTSPGARPPGGAAPPSQPTPSRDPAANP
jgi:transcriptional regulator with XRE-family HTH domain